jgi:hypothetical protein
LPVSVAFASVEPIAFKPFTDPESGLRGQHSETQRREPRNNRAQPA